MNAILGRLCMLAGLIILPIGLSYGLAKGDSRVEEKLLMLGAALFFAGWLLARQRR